MKPVNEKTERKTLGHLCKECRTLSGLTLRQVEEVTGISNAYLSQLESDKIKKPSMTYIYKLSQVYSTPIEAFLLAAGIINELPKGVKVNKLYFTDLTKEEEEELAKYLKFLRGR